MARSYYPQHSAFILDAVLSETDECIDWPYGKSGGRGLVRVGRRQDRVYRVVLRLSIGAAPEDKPEARHTCDNPSCVNPRHLLWGTLADNARDRTSRDRRYNSDLTNQDARDILQRCAAGEVQRHIAKEYGVSPNVINRIAKGHTFRIAVGGGESDR